MRGARAVRATRLLRPAVRARRPTSPRCPGLRGRAGRAHSAWRRENPSSRVTGAELLHEAVDKPALVARLKIAADLIARERRGRLGQLRAQATLGGFRQRVVTLLGVATDSFGSRFRQLFDLADLESSFLLSSSATCFNSAESAAIRA